MASFQTEGVYVPGGFIAGNTHLLVHSRVALLAGEGALAAGSVLGRVTATGKYRLAKAANADGSQTPDAILVEDVNVGASDVEALIYTRGDFIAQGLTLGAGLTLAAITETLRDKNIILRSRQN